MHKLIKPSDTIGRCCIGVAMVAFGIQHLFYLDFVTRLVPKLPAWIPGHGALACGFGVGLITAGLAILLGKATRVTTLLLGTVLLGSFALLHLPRAAADPGNVGLWVNAGKALALAGGAFLVAGSLPVKRERPNHKFAALLNPIETLIPLGPYFLGGFFAYCGILHFIYVKLVADLVPTWIPAHVFWTYFSGLALVAGGVGMIVKPTARLAAGLSALMIFSWVILLHIPRALANVRDSNETTAVFEALAVAGAALLAASRAQRVARTNLTQPSSLLGAADILTASNPKRAGAGNAWPAASREQL
jgi:uncharacterized membrane protein